MHVVLCSVIRNNKRSGLVSVFRLNAFHSSIHVAQYFYWNDWITNFRGKTKTRSDMRSFCLFFRANYDYYCEKWYLNAVELCGWRLQERLLRLQMANFIFHFNRRLFRATKWKRRRCCVNSGFLCGNFRTNAAIVLTFQRKWLSSNPPQPSECRPQLWIVVVDGECD